jgi:hypothetical protein
VVTSACASEPQRTQRSQKELFVLYVLLTSNFVQFREEIQNGPSESVQYELVARRYADTPIRRYIALLWLRLCRAVIFVASYLRLVRQFGETRYPGFCAQSLLAIHHSRGKIPSPLYEFSSRCAAWPLFIGSGN